MNGLHVARLVTLWPQSQYLVVEKRTLKRKEKRKGKGNGEKKARRSERRGTSKAIKKHGTHGTKQGN